MLPTLNVVLAYEEACGIVDGEGRRLWGHARQMAGRRDRRRAAPPHPGKAPRPDLIADRADLSRALLDIRERSGMSYRAMEDRVEERLELGPLSRSTAQRLLTRQSFPTSQRQLMALLHACAVPERAWGDWVDAWKKVHRTQDRNESTITPARRLAALDAETELARYRLESVEPFRSPTAAWSVRCCVCGVLFRVRLGELGTGWGGCPNQCPHTPMPVGAGGNRTIPVPLACVHCEDLDATAPLTVLLDDCPVCRGALVPRTSSPSSEDRHDGNATR